MPRKRNRTLTGAASGVVVAYSSFQLNPRHIDQKRKPRPFGYIVVYPIDIRCKHRLWGLEAANLAMLKAQKDAIFHDDVFSMLEKRSAVGE